MTEGHYFTSEDISLHIPSFLLYNQMGKAAFYICNLL